MPQNRSKNGFMGPCTTVAKSPALLRFTLAAAVYPPTLLASYFADHDMATAIAKASDDDLVGRKVFSKTAGGDK